MDVKTKRVAEPLTFSEKRKVCARLIREVRRLTPAFIPVTLIRQFIAVSIGYIAIYVSSDVLNGLERGDLAEELVSRTLILLGVLFLLNLVSRFMENYSSRIKEEVYDFLDGRMAVKSTEIDYPDLDSPYLNELKNRIDEDNSWGNGIFGAFIHFEYLVYQFFNAIFALVYLVPVVAFLIHREHGLSFVFLFVLLLVLAANGFGESYFERKAVYFMQKMQEKPEDVDLTWEIVEGGGLTEDRKDIKLYGAKSLLRKYLCEHAIDFINNRNEKLSQNEGRKAFINGVFGAGVSGICYFFVTLLAAGGSIAIGSVVRYVACFERLVTALQAMIRDSQQFMLVARRMGTTFEYLDAKGSLYQGKLPVEKRSDDEYEIEFRNVSFRYPGSSVYALKNFSLRLRIGERMAVVGRNGSGKTTMIKLLSRLYDPTEGEILLNGIDIRKFDYHEYMQLVSIVFQDFSLFSFSLARNVATSEEYDAEKVKKCLIQAGFSERLSELPDGIETIIGKEWEDRGIHLSGGERQKIAIARALYKDSPFILLDEPTASLDPLAEFEVYSAFQEMVGSKTAIYISHRLSSCRFCNDIVVFDEGQIVQRGSHEQLMQQTDGLYHSLWMAQAEYYKS